MRLAANILPPLALASLSWAACSGPLHTQDARRTPVAFYAPDSSRTANPSAQAATSLGNQGLTSGHYDEGEGLAQECTFADGRLFPDEAFFNTPIVDLPVARDSAKVVAYLEENHDPEYRFWTDFEMSVLIANGEVERQPFTATENHYSPHCDVAAVPVPPGGNLEGESGYRCDGDGDCHLIVIQGEQCRLYEMWKADIRNRTFRGGCLAIWDLSSVYPEHARGEQCTSADAAGLPIAPLLFTADDLKRGEIQHAIRFILPNKNIRERQYVRPATHATPATKGPPEAPPYGALLRLKADADLSALSPAARVVAKALQTYGMILADGGALTFTALSDERSKAKYSELGFDQKSLTSLKWTDFERIDTGPTIGWTGDCEREQISD